MKIFDYIEAPQALYSADVVAQLVSLHEHKGRQDLFVAAHADTLATLLEIAKIQSTGASNRIEGIFTTDKRLRELMEASAAPRNRSEQEIAGYRDVLAEIHESYDYILPRPNIILQLHKQLYSYSKSAISGDYKHSDNFIAETDAQGNQKVRFQPVPAFLTPEAMGKLCDNFSKAMEQSRFEPLLLIPMFVLDFLCIHPFNDGNGRMSRLLTLLLLYRTGFLVGKYISIEKVIEQSKETYYEALQASSVGWHDNKNDYLPFIRYFLGVLEKASKEFEARVAHLQARKLSKADRVKAMFEQRAGKLTKREIMDLCPDISQVTVERALTDLIKQGFLAKIGAGKSTAYIKTE